MFAREVASRSNKYWANLKIIYKTIQSNYLIYKERIDDF